MKSRKIIVEWIATNYISSDSLDWEVFVLLHGRWDSSKTYVSIMKKLDEDWISYIAPDFPWFWSTEPPLDLNRHVEDYAQWLDLFLKKMWLTKSNILIGHSFGCRVILKWLYSSKLTANNIVLISAWGIQDQVNSTWYLKIWKKILQWLWMWGVVSYLQSKIRSDDYINAGNLEQIFLNTISEDLQYTFEHVSAKTLLIWWDKDQSTPLSHAEIFNTWIHNSDLQIFPWWTHFVHQEFSHEVYQLIKQFAYE